MPKKDHVRGAVRHRKNVNKGTTDDWTESEEEYSEAPDIDKLAMFLFLAVPLTISCFIGE